MKPTLQKQFTDSDGEKVLVALDWSEVNVISWLRSMTYGKLSVLLAKGNIQKIIPELSHVPTKETAIDFLKNEDLLIKLKENGSQSTK